MTNFELIKRHDSDTGFCSVMSTMRYHSTTYDQIIEKGYEIVPDILKYLEKEGGMSIIMLLMDITKEIPYVPEKIENTSLSSWKVDNARNAWIQWGKLKYKN